MRLLLLGLLVTCLEAQSLDDNTVTVTASQPAISQTQAASITVTITAPVGVGFEEILGIAGEAGITAADFNSAYGSYRVIPSRATDWSFTHLVGIDKLKSTLATLTGMQSRLDKGKSGTTLQFDVYSAPPTGDCSYSSLFTDARRQADTLASAAGRRAGSVMALSDGSSVVPTAVARVGDFASFLLGSLAPPTLVNPFTGGVLIGVISAQQPVYSCSLTVQFRMIL